jgi:serine/threonine protein kinase
VSWNPLSRFPGLNERSRFGALSKNRSHLEIIELTRREEIAFGGTALIYRLTYSNGWREVEKTLLPKFHTKPDYENLQVREFEILESLSHPLIIRPVRLRSKPALGGGITNCLILEYVEGVSLSQLWPFVDSLDSVTRVGWAYELLAQLSSAVAYLGEHGVVHGDISPENVLIQRNGLMKLIDFGVASKSGTESSFLVAGRNYFRAPELKVSGGTSHSGDIFAVGRIFTQLLGDGVAEEPAHNEIVKMVTESRKLPALSLPPSGWFEGVTPVPPADMLQPKVSFRPKTKLTLKPSFFSKHRKAVLCALLLLLTPFITTPLPLRAKLTVNTLPYSMVIFRAVNGYVQFDTPIIGVSIPSGKHRIEFIIPSQNYRHIVKHIAVLPGDNVKIFEDFQNLDTLDK